MAKKAETTTVLNEATINSRIENLEKQKRLLEEYKRIRDKAIDDRQWNYMIYHSADNEHEEAWYTVPQEDDYQYAGYVAMTELIDIMDKAVIGG